MSTQLQIKQYFLLLCLLIAAFGTQAQNLQNEPDNSIPDNHERWYQVEMIVFSRNESSAAQQEAWPKNIKLAYPLNLVTLKSADVNDPAGFTMLKPNDRQLNAQAATIAKSGSYTLLFHQAWRQMIYGKKTSILINGGKTFNGHQELEGSIDLSVAQFLKFQTNLWLTQFVSAQAASTIGNELEGWPELPAIPNVESTTNDQPADFVTKRIVKINQQRSMRSVEVHYIDHPLFGIIIKIVPYDAPNL